MYAHNRWACKILYSYKIIYQIKNNINEFKLNMGNDLSSSIIPPPISLNDCVVDGELDIARYSIYKRRVRREKVRVLH